MNDAKFEFDVAVPMRDGTILRADVIGPFDQEVLRPVLVVRTPYGKRTAAMWETADPLTALARGFIVVIQDTRGRGSSEGEFRAWIDEASDGAETIRWAAQLPGSSGAVVMSGTSALGNAQWMAAAYGPPALRAIAPMLTWSDAFDGLFRRGGAEELGLSVWWGLLMGMETLARRDAREPQILVDTFRAIVRDFDELGSAGYLALPAADHPALARNMVASVGNQEVYADPLVAEACSIVGKYDQVDVPAFVVAGWYDIFSQGSLDNYTAIALSEPRSRLIVGPWSHMQQTGMQGDVNFGTGAGKSSVDLGPSLSVLQLDWFQEQLAPLSGAKLTPPVKIFVMGVNKWRDEWEWPLSRAIGTAFYFRADGELADRPQGSSAHSSYTYDPALPVPTVGGQLLLAPEFPAGPRDQKAVEDRTDVLTFTTMPLEEDLEVTGRILATLFVDTDCVSTDWVVRLCDVDHNGVSRNLVDGITRTTHEPGVVTQVDVDLWSTSNVFLAGHRIRVQITSSNFPRWDRNLNTGEHPRSATRIVRAHQTVYYGGKTPSHVTLPVVSTVQELQ